MRHLVAENGLGWLCRFLSAGKNRSGLSNAFESALENNLIKANIDRNEHLHVSKSNVDKPGRSLTYQNGLERLCRFLSAGKNQSGPSNAFESALTLHTPGSVSPSAGCGSAACESGAASAAPALRR